EEITGSLTPGKRADIIMIDSKAINMQPTTDAVSILVEAAQPSNVHSVWVDGRLLKHNGNLTHLSADEVGQNATSSFKEIMSKVI
ncbi:MAG TPA: amidohydrolase family protein, partial [Anditalea sp.]|nr:amidohydrolase family protein [Anditalea sp.]